jgi:hypothetical protein
VLNAIYIIDLSCIDYTSIDWTCQYLLQSIVLDRIYLIE